MRENNYKFPIYRGKDHPRWKGGRRKVGLYMQVLIPDHPFANGRGYIYEHRAVMEKTLGRYLTPKEKVHHINKNGLDNRPENLQLVTDAEHVRIHRAGKKGYPRPYKARPDISARQFGKHHSPEWNANISKAHKGKKHSEEWVRHNVESHKRNKLLTG